MKDPGRSFYFASSTFASVPMTQVALSAQFCLILLGPWVKLSEKTEADGYVTEAQGHHCFNMTVCIKARS